MSIGKTDLLTSAKIYTAFSEGKKFDLLKTEISLLRYMISMNQISTDRLHNTKFFCSIEDLNKVLEDRNTLSKYVNELKNLIDSHIFALPQTIIATKNEIMRRLEEEKKKVVARKEKKIAKKAAQEKGNG